MPNYLNEIVNRIKEALGITDEPAYSGMSKAEIKKKHDELFGKEEHTVKKPKKTTRKSKKKESWKVIPPIKESEIKNYSYPLCDYCSTKLVGFLSAYKCRYCGGSFCVNHHVPESHECIGKPERPPGRYRVRYGSNGQTTVLGK